MHKFSIPMYSTHIHSLFHSLLHVHTYTHTLSTEVINHGLLAGGLDFGTSSNIRPWGKKKRRSTYCTHTHKGAYTHTLATILPSPSSILLPLLSEILVTDTTDLVQVVGVGGGVLSSPPNPASHYTGSKCIHLILSRQRGHSLISPSAVALSAQQPQTITSNC